MKRQLTQEMTTIRTQTRVQVANSYSTYSRKEKRRKGTNALIPYENRKMELDAAINTLDTLIHGIEAKLLEHERDQLDENQRASSSPVTAVPPNISDADIARTARHGLDRYGYDPLDPALLGLSFEQLVALDGPAHMQTRTAIERWWSRNASDVKCLSKIPPDSVTYGTMLVQEIMTVPDDHTRRWLFWSVMNPDEADADAVPAGPVTRHFMWSLALKREPAASGPELAVGQIAIAEKVAACLRDEYPDSPLPRHLGYERLAISAEKAGNYEKAITFSRDAKLQGWAGDWDKRIERCQQKATKER
jgi:hypothetical protein